jgi:hypothetical protein
MSSSANASIVLVEASLFIARLAPFSDPTDLKPIVT